MHGQPTTAENKATMDNKVTFYALLFIIYFMNNNIGGRLQKAGI